MPSKSHEKFNFTRSKLESWPLPADGRICLWDATTPGLACRITSNGARTYYHIRKVKTPDATGKRPVVKSALGKVSEITVDDARIQAAALNSTVAHRENPAEQRKAAERTARAAKLFDAAFTEFIADRRARGTRTVDEMNRKGEIYLREFKGRRLADITHEEVRDLHKRIGAGVIVDGKKYGGRGAANRTLALLRAVFNFARQPANPCIGVTAFEENERQRFLTPDEMAAFRKALNEVRPLMRDYFLVSLFTGQRRGNVQSMRWDELKLEAGTWTIPGAKFKTKKSITIPLANQALVILKARAAENAKLEKPSEYVFPSPHRDSKRPHLTEPKTSWAKILAAAGLADLHIHDLRHTLASWQVAAGSDLHVIGKSLGHRKVQTTARYAHHQLDQVRASINTASDALNFAMQPAVKPKPRKKGGKGGKSSKSMGGGRRRFGL